MHNSQQIKLNLFFKTKAFDSNSLKHFIINEFWKGKCYFCNYWSKSGTMKGGIFHPTCSMSSQPPTVSGMLAEDVRFWGQSEEINFPCPAKQIESNTFVQSLLSTSPKENKQIACRGNQLHYKRGVLRLENTHPIMEKEQVCLLLQKILSSL